MIKIVRDYNTLTEFHPHVPILGEPGFLKSVAGSEEFGWAVNDKFALPFYFKRDFPASPFRIPKIRKIAFATHCIERSTTSPEEEQEFLDGVIAHFSNENVDMTSVSPFRMDLYRAAPRGAKVTEFGTYRVDLKPSEEEIFKNIQKRTRQDIRRAEKDGYYVEEGSHLLECCERLTVETKERQGIRVRGGYLGTFKRLQESLDENFSIMVVFAPDGTPDTAVAIAWKKGLRAYSLYGGAKEGASRNAGKLLYAEAFKKMKQYGVSEFDFVGARLNVSKDSKFYGIQTFKSRMGSELHRGLIWKYIYSKERETLSNSIRKTSFFLRGKKYIGDIVDQEQNANQ